jgi:hypothetical protein
MPGGSFDYLFRKEAVELLSSREDIARMAAALQDAGFPDAALETERLVAMLEHVERQIGARVERLTSVWRAAEWFYSGDIGIDRLREVVTLWRRRDIQETPECPS